MSNIFQMRSLLAIYFRNSYNTGREKLMNIYTSTSLKTLAQTNYGDSSYGTEIYSCQNAAECEQQATVGAPNTGFMGMSESAVVATSAGALLVAIAVIGAIYVIVSRIRRNKKTEG
jgi:hypothetical protein